jgi:hypothetical protein
MAFLWRGQAQRKTQPIALHENQSPLLIALFSAAILATNLADAESPQSQPVQLEEVVVTGRSDDLLGVARSASEGYVGATDLALRPLLRPSSNQ